MAGIVSSYEIGGRDYLHYYATNAETTLSPLYAKINRSKAQIMTGQKNSLNARLNKAKSDLTDKGMKLESAEALLSGESFAELGNIGLTGDVARTFPETSEEAFAILNKAANEVTDIQDFVTLLENYVLNYFKTGDYQQLYQDYAAAIVESFAQSKRRMSGSDSVGDAILNSIIGKYNENFFRMQGKAMNVPTGIAKMLALIGSLPNPMGAGGSANLDSSYNIRSSKSTNVQGTASGEDEIGKTLLAKAQRWVLQMQKTASETAAAKAMLEGNKKLGAALEGLDSTFKTTGNKNFSTNFKPDVKQRDLLQQTGLKSESILQNKRAKSDVSLIVTKDKVTAQVGFTVKDYKASTNDGSTPGYEIALQKETPLITALMREAGISGQDLHSVYQLAVAQGMESTLNYQWDQMVQYAAYRMFLNAAMGFAGTADQSFFMVINGGIYTMSDILNHVMHSDSTVMISEYVNNKNQNVGGLIRETYRQMNEDLWQGERGISSRPMAYKRSQMLEPAVSSMMYMTKIRIDLKISELSILAKNL